MNVIRDEKIAGLARALERRGLTDRAAALRAPLLFRVLSHGGNAHPTHGATCNGPHREGQR